MIVEWLLSVSLAFNEWIAALMPPGEINDASADIQGWTVLYQWVAGVGAWVNVPAMAALASAAMAWYLATLAAKLVRVVVSHVPFFGGSG